MKLKQRQNQIKMESAWINMENKIEFKWNQHVINMKTELNLKEISMKRNLNELAWN